ncbi:hypothetical protein F5Y00DRAFT_233608 [Daldinia vernicosa]|uniref:uncharacterized protein n=1 Tax=Daldinia vernicosa TaxID=114800 RepID=UPI0020073D05|nr:uncharacterized protein F5Y00DRAFT_233608 [Daldinia vernicosa]KAI0850100.1 hypothetical protein F5Y00DRAFT_233608 [Daldinia vernicosa]
MPSPTYQLTNMPKLNYAARGSTNDAIYQLARVADTLHSKSLDKVDLLEEYIDRELEKRSSDSKNALEKVSTTIQSLRGNVNHTSQAQQTKNKMIDCLDLLQTQIQTMYTDHDGFGPGFKDLKYKIAEVRSNQHDLRDVLRMIHADVQTLHESTEISGFPQFRRLPLEIRAMIWDLAIPNRILGLDEDLDIAGVYHFKPGLSPPSVAHVCKEARSIACRSGRLVSIRNYWEDQQGMPRPAWSWYDPSRDSLRLCIGSLVGSPNATILEITECTQSVISGGGSDNTLCYRLLSYLSDPHYFPHLKVVGFISDTYVYRELRDHIVEIRLFSLDRRNSISVDVDDEAAKKGLIYRITKDHSSIETNQLVSWLEDDTGELWSDLHSTNSVRKLKWPHFLDHLRREWILAKSWYSSGDGHHDTQQANKSGKQIPRLSEARAVPTSESVPVFQRVKLIEQEAVGEDGF